MAERDEAASRPDPIRNKAIRLFQYLGALAELRAKNVRDVTSYEAVFWFNELPCEKECYTPAWNGGEAADEQNWLRIDKPLKPVLSLPPAECEHWFDAATLDDVSAEPRLYDEIVDPQWLQRDRENDESDPTSPPYLLLSDHSRVAAAWSEYLETNWRPWRIQYQRWARVQRAYRKLFAIYQEQQRRGEQYELLLGVGALVWRTPSGQTVRRPIVTARVTIDIERESGCITIAPAMDGANFSLEQDMLEVNERPLLQDQRAIENGISNLESPWNREVITPILKSWLHTLPSAADAVYHDVLDCPDRAAETPQLAFAPILILRKRGAQTVREMLRRIVKGLREGKSTPHGVRQLCGAVDDSHRPDGLVSEGLSTPDGIPDDILFPLPSNDEQLAIIRRLYDRSAVLVQGPPGTGKSHTIVNLVSHLLACGRRVLVTSQTPRALKVLRDKIPEPILPLTVSLLGEDAESRHNLEHSVQGILRYVNTTNPAHTQRHIDQAIQERGSLKSALAALRRQQLELREAETNTYFVLGTSYQGTAQAIAQAVARDSCDCSWLSDTIAATAEPPLTNDELQELYSLWERQRDHSLVGALPELATLPTADAFEKAAEAYVNAQTALAQFGELADAPSVQGLRRLGRSQLSELQSIAPHVIQLSEWIAKRTEPWSVRVRQEVFTGRALTWISLEAATSKALESLAGHLDGGSDADLETPPGVSRSRLLADATDLLVHLNSGRSLGFGIFRPRVVKRCTYLWRDTRLAGRRCDSPAVLASLMAHLRAQQMLDRTWQEWSHIAVPPTGTSRHRLACLKHCRNVLRAILQLRQLASDIENITGETTGAADPAHSTAWGEELLSRVQVALALLDAWDAQANLSALSDRVIHCRTLAEAHPIAGDLAVSAEQGNVRDYRQHLERLAELHHQRSLAERCLSLDRRLRTVAPILADTIKSAETRLALATRLDSFGRAWAWKRATAWLEQFTAAQSVDLTNKITQTERRLQETTQALVALKSWKSCLEKLTSNPTQQGALIAWQQMVKRIGKGTGKYADTYRRDARKYMRQCRNAIPAWIMPLHRVAEQVDAEPEIFDVVIVDESSQTGPEGLILQYLAKQCIIVGDDKQISPEGRFIDSNQIRLLKEQYLDGVPFAETLDPATSLFDQAAVRYGSRITLRQHFRCMPEIIRFSNELCYTDTPLIPLRQYSPSRLPPIQVRFVNDGYREGKSQNVINRPEAAAVAKTVIDCLNDSRYKGKSFGIICLQGHAQAQLIENLLLEAIGPAPFQDERTRLLCGDPYSFQGDERDIVFLSMIASVVGEGRSAPLTHETFRQRFNVAASRARDQAWVFHSIRESELHPDCMRRRLLNAYYNPTPRPVTRDGHGRNISQFQQDVGEALIRAGFRLIPEYEVAGRYIDWVVEDGERRLAIECDGDAWHGPDRYEADMARQRMLERCGWTFIRIRGSVFYANPPKAIDDLVSAIRAHGLEPCLMSDDHAAPRDWVQEISGHECMVALGTRAADSTANGVVQQQELFSTDSEDPSPHEVAAAMLKANVTKANEGPTIHSTTRSNPVSVQRLLEASKPEDDELGTPSTSPKARSLAARPTLRQRTVSARTSGTPTPANQPRSDPASGESTGTTPAPAKGTSIVVSAQERQAVFKALNTATKPLIMWQLAEATRISPHRIKEVIPVLVREGLVKRLESDDAVRYVRT